MNFKSDFETLEVQLQNGVLSLNFNRPKRFNAFNPKMYAEVVEALKLATDHAAVRVVVVTGNGDYYSSGNDLSSFTTGEVSIESGVTTLNAFIEAFLFFPKVLIAAVNGPAIGVAASTLAHFDFVYASEKATFNTPFVPLAQSPEACSSVLFPKLMGTHVANEFLLLGKKFSAVEAQKAGLVGEVVKHEELLPRAFAVAKQLANSPPESLLESKKLIRNPELLNQLHKVHKKEVEVLAQRWQSEEFLNAIATFFARKKSAL